MTFAQRKVFARSMARRTRTTRSRVAEQLEKLEPRVMLSSTVLDKTGVSWGGTTIEAVRNQYVLQSAAANAATLVSQMRAAGLNVSGAAKLASGLYQIVDASDSSEGIKAWSAMHPDVVTTISPNRIYKALNTYPNEISQSVYVGRDNYWWIDNTGVFSTVDNMNQPLSTARGADTKAAQAWDLGTGNRNIIVAVLDTGVADWAITDLSHPDLRLAAWHNPSDTILDGIDTDNNGVDDPYGANFTTFDAGTGLLTANGDITDNFGHGTHVAGIIGATGNNRYTAPVGNPPVLYDGSAAVGINWGVTILPVKVLGDDGTGSLASIIAGIEYVTNLKRRGVNIVAANMSLGGPYDGPINGIGDPGGTIQMYQALDRAMSAGIIFTVAAGNDGTNNDIFKNSPADASNPLLLTVAASTPSDTLATFSNYGSRVQLAAPGEFILSTISRITDPTILDIGPPPGAPPHNEPTYGADGLDPYGYSFLSGTSMASPMVAGAAALLKSIVPSATPQQIVNAILAGVDKSAAYTGYVTSGGRLNIRRSAEILLGSRPAVGSVDVFNSTSISGWAYDPNIGNQPVQGYVMIDGAVVQGFSAGTTRADLGKVAYGLDHGFNIDLSSYHLTPGQHKIDVYILDIFQQNGNTKNVNGNYQTATLLASKTIEGNMLPVGTVDVASAALIAGWALDANTPNDAISVRIDIDGQTVTTIPAGSFYGNAVGNHGYSYTPNLSAGVHRVDVYALDDYTGNPVLLGTRTINTNQDIVYTGLQYSGGVLSGYVVDPDSGFSPVSLQIMYDGAGGQRQYLNAVANQPGNPAFATLTTAPGDTNHAFSVPLTGLAPGSHTVRIYAFDNETGKKTELLFNASPINHNATGTVELLNSNVSDQFWTATISDPDHLGQLLYYRVDYDNSVGPLQMATANTFTFSAPLFSAGTHRMRFNVFDADTLQPIQLYTQTFVSPSVFVGTGNTRSVNPTGTVDLFGPQLFQQAQLRGISGTATDNNNTNHKFVTVSLVIDGDSNKVLTTIAGQDTKVFWFTPQMLQDAVDTGIITYGRHYAQLYALDTGAPDDSPTGLYTLLGEGELVLTDPATKSTTRPNGYTAAGTLTDVNMQNISGTISVHPNDPAPATFALAETASNAITVTDIFSLNPATYVLPGVGGVVNGAPIYRLDVNGSVFTNGSLTVSSPGSYTFDPFTAATPQLTTSAGNVVGLGYFDPFIGGITPLASKSMVPYPSFNLVNGRLVITGNVAPVGNLDTVSANQIAGWVRDYEAPSGTGVVYRLDYDNIIGTLGTATLARADLATQFGTDINHGFSVTPPKLTAGTHTVKFWALDPLTGLFTQIGQRAFTVLDDANKRPIGASERITGTVVSGWAQDPTTPASPVTIKLYVDGSATAAATTTTTIARPDLPTRNGVPVKGYSFTLPGTLSAGQHYVQVVAVDSTDSTREILLGASSVYVGASTIAGVVDVANFQSISGWVMGAANDANPQFRMDINGIPYKLLDSTDATELTAANEGGLNIWRFNLAAPPLATSVANVVTLYYIDPNTKDAIRILSKAISPLKQVIGSVDGVTNTLISGWAFSPTLPNAKIVVQLSIDGVAADTTTAGLDRRDLTGQLAGHAFQFNTPTLGTGTHQITIRFLDPVTGDFSVFSNTTLLVTA